MNREEAKVPDVEGDWQSIEIFLFSNGQQNSPPRKYVLRVDDLNLWDATLNLLAQSHYGLKSPTINLYTINGHLVKGPLDIRDGQAYVAVAPPDTFIDAGYQKYLIRASRSWEKRQARKKPPECVPNEPCCLCPEKERSCCDPQACCLCPEKEDADSMVLILPATVLPRLSSAAPHYISSVSANPGEFGYSAVPAPDKQNAYGTGLSQNRATLTEDGARTYENVARQSEYGLRPDKHANRLNEYGGRPSECATRPSENEARPGENVARPGEYGAGQGKCETRSSVNGTRPVEYETKQSACGNMPGEYEAKPGEYGTRPSVNGTRPVEYETKPSATENMPGEYGATPGEYGARPSVNGTRPVVYETKQSAYGNIPGEYGAKPGEYGSRPSVNGTRPVEYETKPSATENMPGKNSAKPVEYGARPSVNGTRPVEYETKPIVPENMPGEYGTKPGEYGARPSVNETRPVEYETKQSAYGNIPGKYGAKPDKYGARPSVNRTRPVEYETKPSATENMPGKNSAKPVEYGARASVNGTRPVEYETKPIAPENMPGENEVKLGEYGAEPGKYDTRPGANGSKPAEYGARPGQYDARPGEYETQPSVNAARPGEFKNRPAEYETKPCTNGAKPGEYGVRPGKYETRPSVNGVRQGEFAARLAEYVARSGEYETTPIVNGARPGELGARSVEYETKPRMNGAKPDDYGPRPEEYETRLCVNGTRQTEYKTRPGEYNARPVQHETKPNINGPNPDEYRAKQGEYDRRLSVNGARPGEYEAKPTTNGSKTGRFGAGPGEYDARLAEYETRLGEYGAKPAEYETKPSLNGAKPIELGAKTVEYVAKPSEYATRSAEQENKPDEYRLSPANNGSWSGVDGDRTTGHKARPGYSGPRSSKIEPIKEAYEIALRENKKSLDESEDKLDKDKVDKVGLIWENENEKKGEYKTREGDKKVKKIEPKDRSSGNGKSGSERRISGGEKNIRESDTVRERMSECRARKNENARRLSGHGGAEIDQGGRTGELSRGFEYGGRLSAQKARETNPTVRTGGPGARENVARLSEQGNRQSDNLARLGGRESRVGDHEARAGDLGFPISGCDAGLGNPDSREVESGARSAVSGARASPRDKISSRAKTSNLGQPKIGTPGTKVDETLVKSGDPDTTNRESNSGAKESRVGGTEGAGALHISEAQQHARRINLSAGRPSIEKKRFSIGQNSSLLRKPNPNSSLVRKLEDKHPIKTNKENLPKKINEKSSIIPVPASNDSGKSKTQKSQPTRITPLPTSAICITNVASLTTNEASLENVIDEKEIIVLSTHSIKDPKSETKSIALDLVKQIVDAVDNTPEETQTQMIYIEKCMKYVSVNEGVQTSTEEVEQRKQEVSASCKEKVNSCTCTLCKPTKHRVASDPDENTLSMLNKGGVVNIKLNIEVRNIVKSVYSCQKNMGNSRSLINITRSEKESQISIDNDVVVHPNSLQSLFTKQNFRGFGFDGSPNVMVVQCDGCGRLNNPSQCDPPPCCDSNKKYFVLLNSVLEDMEDGCNFNPPCRPCDQRQSKKQNSGIPIKQAFSETTLDTITTVTVSGVPLQRREMGKCATNTSCQTEEPQGECMMAKHKVSITQESVTRCDLQKQSSSSICVEMQAFSIVPQQNCLKMCSQKCEQEDSLVFSEPCSTGLPLTCEKVRPICSQVPPLTCEKVRPIFSQVPPPTCEKVRSICSHVPPPTCEKVRSTSSHVPPSTCEKVRSTCSHVPPPTPQVSSQACPQVQSKGCQQISPQLQSQGCIPVSATCPLCCPKTPPPYMQVQTHACPQEPKLCNAETQTRWASILLQARLHGDGRYSFHLPPLHLLKNNYSCCQ